MFNDRLEVHNNTMVKIQHTWHTHIIMGARKEGARISVPPPPHGKSNNFLGLYGWPFSYFFSTWGPFRYVFLLMGGPFSPCEGLSAPLFSMWGSFLLSWGAFYGWAPMNITYIIILSC